MSLLELSATELLTRMSSGELTSVEICETYLDRLEAVDDQVGAFLHVDRGGVLQMADAIDHRRETGQSVGAMAGLPVAIKDVLCTRGNITSCGSRMLEEYVSPYDATVVAKLKQADAVVIGKTNLDEFAMGSSTENSAFQPTRNPWNTDKVPGGSSGGSAAAVAARSAPLAIGTDTGGSIRQPASFCGTVGLKPTYGRVSRYGLVAFASSLDQIGPLARTVEDAALLLEATAGHDQRDSTSAAMPVPRYAISVKQPLTGLRLGWIAEHFDEGLDSEVEAAIREARAVYESLGATIVEIHMPHARYGIATYYIIAPCEASSNLARYDGMHYGHRANSNVEAVDVAAGQGGGDGPLVRAYRRSRSEGFGDEVKRRIMLGTYALSAGYYDAYYLKAQRVRRLIRDDYDQAFQQVDFLIGPVAPTTAFACGERVNDPMAMYLGDLYTVTANLAGIPAISVPCGYSQAGLPIGLHLQAAPFDEARLLQAAYMYQEATDWHQRSPTL